MTLALKHSREVEDKAVDMEDYISIPSNEEIQNAYDSLLEPFSLNLSPNLKPIK